jgi:YbbR domain-containing protein
MLERLRNNLSLKLLSFALAICAWGYLRLTPNPVFAARFVQQFDVPITTTGLGSDAVARFTERHAVVAVEEPHGGAIKPDDVKAVLNLAGRGAGVYNVPVEVIAPKLQVKSLSPASVTLAIERIEERSVPVVFYYTGEVRHKIVVSHVSVAPAAVTVRAPTSDLNQVASVRVDVPLPAAPGAFDAMERPVAVDVRGNEIAALSVAPNLLRVRATFVAAAKR